MDLTAVAEPGTVVTKTFGLEGQIPMDDSAELRRINRSNRFRKLLNLPPIAYRPDYEAPPVDMDLLESLIRRELSPKSCEAILGFIGKYRPWERAYHDLLQKLATSPPDNSRTEHD